MIVAPKVSNVKDFFVDNFPKFAKCKCCLSRPKSRNKRALIKAREELYSEMNFICLVKRMRYFEKSIEKLLPESVRKQLKA